MDTLGRLGGGAEKIEVKSSKKKKEAPLKKRRNEKESR